jgi:hypothetical protein
MGPDNCDSIMRFLTLLSILILAACGQEAPPAVVTLFDTLPSGTVVATSGELGEWEAAETYQKGGGGGAASTNATQVSTVDARLLSGTLTAFAQIENHGMGLPNLEPVGNKGPQAAGPVIKMITQQQILKEAAR